MVGAVSLNTYVSSYQYSGGYGRNMQVQAGNALTGNGRVRPGDTAAGSMQVQAGQNTGAVAGSRSVSAGRAGGVSSLIGARSIAAAGQAAGVAAVSAGRAADPESPVEPVDKVSVVQPGSSGSTNYMIPFLRKGMDPAEFSVRMRMQYVDASGQGRRQDAAGEAVRTDLPGAVQEAGKEAAPLDYLPGTSQGAGKEAVQFDLPGAPSDGAVQAELPGTSAEKAAVQAGVPGSAAQQGGTQAASGEDAPKIAGMGMENAQKTSEEAECKTCKERKYQDGSNDPGVSFKTPTHVGPDQAASAVRGHELEHVVRERAKAQSEGRRVISQSVTMQTGICPECGRVYVAGGMTRTTTAADTKKEEPKDPRWILASDI